MEQPRVGRVASAALGDRTRNEARWLVRHVTALRLSVRGSLLAREGLAGKAQMH